ncbi:TniQ family protein [Roseateles flavus]|uniref:TniQ family protein n=1 Tax=Roseateles flavus TaxID=3149041 RepID=A0ABV0GKA6_9BURK
MIAVVPEPFPDESVRSIFQRIGLLNGGRRSRCDNSQGVLAVLVNQAGLPEKSLITDHSHVGYLRFVSKAHAAVPVHSHSDRFANPSLTRWPTAGPRVCLDCIGEDLHTRGISYYRRAHQLPGVEACLTHAASLVLPSPDQSGALLVGLPEKTRPVDPSFAEHLEHPVIERFVSLSMMALKSIIPIAPSGMTAALGRRAAMHGVRITVSGKGRRLSDWARSVLPAAWVATHFAALHQKPIGEHAPSVDDVFRARHVAHKTASYLLAMALLWDSAEDAMRDCAAAPTHTNCEVPTGAGRRALRAVLDGKSIISACRAEGANMQALEIAMRAALREGSFPTLGSIDGTC